MKQLWLTSEVGLAERRARVVGASKTDLLLLERRPVFLAIDHEAFESVWITHSERKVYVFRAAQEMESLVLLGREQT